MELSNETEFWCDKKRFAGHFHVVQDGDERASKGIDEVSTPSTSQFIKASLLVPPLAKSNGIE